MESELQTKRNERVCVPVAVKSSSPSQERDKDGARLQLETACMTAMLWAAS